MSQRPYHDSSEHASAAAVVRSFDRVNVLHQ